MFSEKERVIQLLRNVIKEMDLIASMSAPIVTPNDFGTNLEGMTIFRACSMSLQYTTESFVKIRNIWGMDYFNRYKGVPWGRVFGMRNFLAHEYVEVDEEAIFSTIKEDIPELKEISERMLNDLESDALSN